MAFLNLSSSELPGPPGHVSVLVTSDSSLFVAIKEPEGDAIGLITRYRGRWWQRRLQCIINQKVWGVGLLWIKSDAARKRIVETRSHLWGWRVEVAKVLALCAWANFWMDFYSFTQVKVQRFCNVSKNSRWFFLKLMKHLLISYGALQYPRSKIWSAFIVNSTAAFFKQLHFNKLN